MLTDRYDPVDLFAMVPGLCLQMEPVLAQLDQLLEDDRLFASVRADLARRHPHTLTRGRHSTPVEVILRLLVVKRLYGWSYEQTEYFVADSLVLRQFCRLSLQPPPDDTTLLRWANLIGPATVAQLNDRVVELARQLKVTRGRKLRVDTTVVPTNIHHPTDSALLGDGVRVLSRLLRRAKRLTGVLPALGELGRDAFRSRTRTVRRLAQQFHRLARKKGEEAVAAMKATYERQLTVVRASVRQAQ
jgi:IS5 family transposase